jgi:N-acetylglutamate synthase-like GNAT family acetyltransferase
MEITPLEFSDLGLLTPLQPPGWSDIIVRSEEYIRSSRHFPLKALSEGRLVGTGTTILHEDSAWLATIITHPDFRNKGIGSSLTSELIRSIDPVRYTTVFLDATDLGYPVYKKLGFEQVCEYMHYKNVNLEMATRSENIFPYQSSFYNDIMKLDRFVSGEDRSFLLGSLIETAFVYTTDGHVTGAYFPGVMEGLIIADDPKSGIELMKLRFRDHNYTALPAENFSGNEFLQRSGFIPFRKSRRMRLWKDRNWNASMLYSRISGQLG